MTAPPELAPLQAAVARAAHEALEPPATSAAPVAPDSPPTPATRNAPATPGTREDSERPFQPHVTLARCPSPWPRGAAEKFAAAFPGEIGPPFVADRGVLVESRLSPRGPRYRHVAELPLAAASGAEAGSGGEPGPGKAAAGGEHGSGEERGAGGEPGGAGEPGIAEERSA